MFFGFTSSQQEINFRVAISFLSIDQALINLRAEAPQNVTFDDVATNAANQWEQALSIIEVQSPEPEDNLIKFYTALYHSLLAPTIFSEVGGVYLGFDDQQHTVVAGMIKCLN